MRPGPRRATPARSRAAFWSEGLIRVLATALLAAAGLATMPLDVAPAEAHGFSSVVYAHVASAGTGDIRTTLELEYDLLVVSAADAAHDDALFRAGTDAFDAGDRAQQARAIADHRDAVAAYVTRRLTVRSGETPCPETVRPGVRMTRRQGVPYAVIGVDAQCRPSSDGHLISARLFPDAEGYVRDTKTILTYDLDRQVGSAALDAQTPSFSTRQSTGERFWEFFHLGAEHLLTGIDHILFLLALIAGSRRFREVVLAATTFTLAHSVTFILAATHLLSAPAQVVEPTIALSIAIVAAWHLWRLWRRGRAANTLDTTSGPLGLDRAGWLRLLVVFAFGLVHGLGFASALGIEEPWSWTLLWSLLVFNLGIEAVQLTLIAAVFPLLVLLRRRSPRVGLWATGVLAATVSVFGLVWFVQRLLGI